MAIELYLQPELEELITDGDKKGEWEQKIIELELEGQQMLTENSPNDAASPYTLMNKQMKLVFETLCPTKALVEKYNKTAIPLDVLSHVALCKQEGYFKKMEVWYDEMNPDPILVGYVTDTYSSSILHCIARWGDEVIPYEQLVQKAIRRYTEAYKIGLQGMMAQGKSFLDTAEVLVKQFFIGTKNEYNLRPEFTMPRTGDDFPF